jgi:glutamine amidotransferase
MTTEAVAPIDQARTVALALPKPTLAELAVSVALVDYGAGNLLSIGQALTVLGADVRVVRRAGEVGLPDLVVVPGVGAQGPAMRRLRRTGLETALAEAVAGGAWFLGICLGMQLLFERSEEGGFRGLGWIAGETRRLPSAPRLPHIGWNELEVLAPHRMLDGLPPRAPMYFIHSYAPVPNDRGVVVAETSYGGRFASAVVSGRLLGLQFHPEKSGRDGLRVLRNVLELAVRAPARVARDGSDPAGGAKLGGTPAREEAPLPAPMTRGPA